MSLFSSLAGAFVITVSVSGSPDSRVSIVSPPAPHTTTVRAAILQVAECDQSRKKTITRFVIPLLELDVTPPRKKPDADDDGPTGFCAAFSGPMGSGPRCDFQLLA